MIFFKCSNVFTSLSHSENSSLLSEWKKHSPTQIHMLHSKSTYFPVFVYDLLTLTLRHDYQQVKNRIECHSWKYLTLVYIRYYIFSDKNLYKNIKQKEFEYLFMMSYHSKKNFVIYYGMLKLQHSLKHKK